MFTGAHLCTLSWKMFTSAHLLMLNTAHLCTLFGKCLLVHTFVPFLEMFTSAYLLYSFLENAYQCTPLYSFLKCLAVPTFVFPDSGSKGCPEHCFCGFLLLLFVLKHLDNSSNKRRSEVVQQSNIDTTPTGFFICFTQVEKPRVLWTVLTQVQFQM
jgi:hypothetical protein